MPGGEQWSYWLLVILLGTLVVVEEWLHRRRLHLRHDAQPEAMGRRRDRPPITLLLAPIVTVGALWLIPWAAALYVSGPAALLPGLLMIVPVIACARCALRGTERRE